MIFPQTNEIVFRWLTAPLLLCRDSLCFVPMATGTFGCMKLSMCRCQLNVTLNFRFTSTAECCWSELYLLNISVHRIITCAPSIIRWATPILTNETRFVISHHAVLSCFSPFGFRGERGNYSTVMERMTFAAQLGKTCSQLILALLIYCCCRLVTGSNCRKTRK